MDLSTLSVTWIPGLVIIKYLSNLISNLISNLKSVPCKYKLKLTILSSNECSLNFKHLRPLSCKLKYKKDN